MMAKMQMLFYSSSDMAFIIGSGLKSSPAQGLGENSGDYWAMSYSRSLNQ